MMYALWIFFLLLIIEEMCEFIYRKTNIYKQSREQTIRLKEIPYGLDVVNIGSGPAYYGIDYKYCSKKGYNLATAPQNFIYGYRLLKHNAGKIKENAVIIIIIMAPMSFGHNMDIYSPDYSDKYYGVLDPKDIDGYSSKRRFLIYHPLAYKVFKKIKNKLKKKSMANVKHTIVENWIAEFNLKDLKDAQQADNHKEMFKEKIDLLSEMIEFCCEKKWKPVLVTPPIPKETRDQVSDDFLEVFVYDNIALLQKRFKNLKYINYYSDSQFDSSCFRNDIFVNDKGKELFSNMLFSDVLNIDTKGE